MAQPHSTVLLRSRGGSLLPTEICLKIVEDVIAADPNTGTWALMNTSKAFYKLLQTYQHSIVRTISSREQTKDQFPGTLLPSWPRRPGAFISENSYPWLGEVRCRTHTVKTLTSFAVLEMQYADGRSAIDLPTPDVPKAELCRRAERFISEALNLLYGIADCTATSTNVHITRGLQRAFLDSLSVTKLAMLGILVRVLGMTYFRTAKKVDGNKTSESIRDRWIVFEDRALRCGPFFAYATFSLSSSEMAIRDWSAEVIAEGLDDMEAFETGKREGYASLQSCLWKLFCSRHECDLFDSWEEAKELVEQEMVGYNV